ncbi:MAG: heme-binding protein [Betaproteobacteria bacterium]|nr:heme-binding protein [Betaproteobacteria bacterium]
MDVEMIASLGLAAADEIASLALVEAGKAGVAICVALVDRAGHTLVFKRQPGAPLHSIDIALDKAYTAVSFGLPTGKWDKRLADGSEMLRHGLMHRERFVSFGGGLPIKVDGVRVGAIGISGGSEAQDVAFGEAALAAWQEKRTTK